MAFAVLLVSNNIQDQMDQLVKSKWEDPSNNNAVYAFEVEFDCCDWPGVSNVTGRLPCNVTHADNSTVQNCRDAALSWLEHRYLPIGIVALILGALQV